MMASAHNTWGDPGNRSEADAINALKGHIWLLRYYRKCAFEDGDYAYLGEIACKLRLLTSTDRNRPLLLDLMALKNFDDRFRAEALFRLIPGEPPQGDPTLRKYLAQYSAFEGITLGKGRWRKTHADLISEWANKLGAVHEDPAPPEWLYAAFHTPVVAPGHPAHVQWLQHVTDIVLDVGERFLNSIGP